MTDANQWLEENYPQNGVCLIDDWYKNKGKKRSEITHLDVTEKNLTGTLDVSSFSNLVGLSCWGNQLTNIILSLYSSLKFLVCSNNRLTNLNLSNYFSLETLSCFNNQLTFLNLPKSNKLVKICASNNYLTTFNYTCLNPLTLRELRIENNNLAVTNLQVFACFINLTNLSIGNDGSWIKKENPANYDNLINKLNKVSQTVQINQNDETFQINAVCNKFTGSLSSFRNLTKLENLHIVNLPLQSDLEYLPGGLWDLICVGQMREELFLYGQNLMIWQACHPDLMKIADKEIIKLTDLNLQLKKQIRAPFSGILKSVGTTNYNQRFQYNYFFLRDRHSFSWEWEASENNILFGESNSKNKNLLKNDSVVNLSKKFQNQLPLRLYNLVTKKVINSGEIANLNNYLTLSYCWGTDWENTSKEYGQNYPTKLTKLGRKALNKVHATYDFLKKENVNFPNYIWIDNFCINQSDREEKEQEVSKQRNYYANSTLTLIAIDEDLSLFRSFRNIINELGLTKRIICKIIDSPWFHRSWTFQEGVLSKQTIFMFDDELIDGRKLALVWGGMLGSYNQLPHTFITPPRLVLP